MAPYDRNNFRKQKQTKGAVLVGVRGFEPPTPSSRTKCATRLRHTPILANLEKKATQPIRKYKPRIAQGALYNRWKL